MSGQAQIEVVAGVSALLAAGLICFQLLAAGLTVTLADGAAEAGALALAGGGDPQEAAHDALPGFARGRVEVEVEDGRIEVSLRPRTVIPGAGGALEVTSVAHVRGKR